MKKFINKNKRSLFLILFLLGVIILFGIIYFNISYLFNTESDLNDYYIEIKRNKISPVGGDADNIVYHCNNDLCSNVGFQPMLEQEIDYNTEIAKDEFVRYLRRAFDDYLSGNYIKWDKNNCEYTGLYKDKHCEDEGYMDLAEYKNYIGSKFIVLQTDIAVGGGESIVLIFKDKPDKLFYAWVYSDDIDKYFDLRAFNEHWQEEDVDIAYEQRIYINQICDKNSGI